MIPDERRCTATSKQSGERCKQPRKGMAPVCHYHGGNIGQVRRKAQERAVEAKARKVLADVAGDFDPLGNPLEALEDMAKRMIRFTDVMGELVGRLENIRYAGASGEQLRAEVAVYSRAMVDTVNALEKIGRLDIDGRLAAIQGAQADRVVRVVTIVLDIVGAEGELRERARRAAAEELRRVIEPNA